MSTDERVAVIALLDAAMVEAARQHAGGESLIDMVDLHVAFVQPASGSLSVTARVCGGGRSVCFCEAEASDAAGRLVARAMATLRSRRAG